MLNGKVTSYITSLVSSGRLSPEAASSLADGVSEGISSVQSIDSLPPEVQALVKDAFQQGTRWAMISLIPWAGLSFLTTIWLSSIRDTDREAREAVPQAGAPRKEEAGDEEKQVAELVVREPGPEDGSRSRTQ